MATEGKLLEAVPDGASGINQVLGREFRRGRVVRGAPGAGSACPFKLRIQRGDGRADHPELAFQIFLTELKEASLDERTTGLVEVILDDLAGAGPEMTRSRARGKDRDVAAQQIVALGRNQFFQCRTFCHSF